MRRNNHPLAKTLWFLGVLGFAAPALISWIVLAVGHAEGCRQGAAQCGSLPFLGTVFKHTLDLAWALALDGTVLVPLGLLVALAAIMARSPARAFIGVFGGPTLALFLPVLVVMSAAYPGCRIDESGSSCTFWGVPMGDSFTAAAVAPWLVYIIPPVGFAAALAVMAVAYIVKRQTPAQRA
ncbi:MAG: hypothetical protein KGJ78_17300 [Alphaproteobacteria bacterium]|nr:hypothetical protein [Alphaproteobacteria bacterium]